MSLEVHIYGPGFGETIFLRWPVEGGGWRGALVDGHSSQDGAWLAGKLRELNLTELEFVTATHPHLDHIRNLAAGLERSGIRLAQGFYWPPFTPGYLIQFFDRLAAQRQGELPETAEMIRQWFGFWDLRYERHRLAPRDLSGRKNFPDEYLTAAAGTPLRVKAIGPWLDGPNKFVKNVSASIGKKGAIKYKHRDANQVSIALLIEYGDAQIVLGGDMEEINWNALRGEANCPQFRPSLVKVSHHGSSNGRIEGMWPCSNGFFGDKPEGAIAVVTPWRQGKGNLPGGNKILHEIRDAGFKVYVTGVGSTPRYRFPESHISVRVNPDCYHQHFGGKPG